MQNDLEVIIEDIKDYTHEEALADLIAIEQKIADKLGLVETYGNSIRRQLIVIDRNHQLYEDTLVADWHQQICWVYF